MQLVRYPLPLGRTCLQIKKERKRAGSKVWGSRVALGAVGGDEGHEGRLDAGSQQAQHVRVARQHRHRHHLPLELQRTQQPG